MEKRNNYRFLEGIEVITFALKKYNIELIKEIGKIKNLSPDEVDKLLDKYVKVSYFTPDVVKQQYKEDIQRSFIGIF
tara:strand:+ start:190 stop:420 length:231 start_codon:yes stop_codon:yes gene_type:complete